MYRERAFPLQPKIWLGGRKPIEAPSLGRKAFGDFCSLSLLFGVDACGETTASCTKKYCRRIAKKDFSLLELSQYRPYYELQEQRKVTNSWLRLAAASGFFGLVLYCFRLNNAFSSSSVENAHSSAKYSCNVRRSRQIFISHLWHVEEEKEKKLLTPQWFSHRSFSNSLFFFRCRVSRPFSFIRSSRILL